jgi:hypothetical protein
MNHESATTRGLAMIGRNGGSVIHPNEMPAPGEWAKITLLAEKKDAFEKDIYFRECWADAIDVFGCSVVGALAPLAILTFKPDAIIGRRMTATADFIEAHGFVPAVTARVRLNRHSMRELWRHDWHVYTTDRLELSTLLYSVSETLMLVLRDTRSLGAISGAVRLSELKGPSEPENRNQGHLRAVLKPPNKTINFVHVCDEPADILRELGILLDRPRRKGLLRNIKEQASASAWAELAQEIAELEAKYPAHDLNFERSLARLKRSKPASDADIARIGAAAKEGRKLSWDELCAIVDPMDGDMDVWDFICVACDVLPLNREAHTDFPRSVGAAGWER